MCDGWLKCSENVFLTLWRILPLNDNLVLLNYKTNNDSLVIMALYNVISSAICMLSFNQCFQKFISRKTYIYENWNEYNVFVCNYFCF